MCFKRSITYGYDAPVIYVYRLYTCACRLYRKGVPTVFGKNWWGDTQYKISGISRSFPRVLGGKFGGFFMISGCNRL